MDVIQLRTELSRQLRSVQEKYDYWLMAVAASAIALAVHDTRETSLHWHQLTLACAVLRHHRRQRQLPPQRSLPGRFPFLGFLRFLGKFFPILANNFRPINFSIQQVGCVATIAHALIVEGLGLSISVPSTHHV